MRIRILFVLLALGVLFVSAGVVLIPRLGERYIKAQDKPGQLWTSAGHGVDYAGPVVEVLPSIEISAPRTIRLTKSASLAISIWGTPIGHSSDLIPGSEGTASDESPKIDNRLEESYTVDVKAHDDTGLVCAEPKTKKMAKYPASIEPRVWNCTLHPKQAGDYDILISGLPSPKEAGNRFLVSDAPEGGTASMTIFGAGARANGPTYERLPGGDVRLPLQVLTSQGLTAIQFIWLQSLGALIGTLGTVFTYPYIKSKFDKSAPSATLSPAKLSLDDMTINEVGAEMISNAGNVVFRYKLPVLQLFVRNAGGEVAVVSRAKLSVKRPLHLQRPLMQHLKPSATYNIDIDPSRKAPYDIEIPVSHSVPPNDADRFDITLGLDPLSAFESVYLIEISLFVNNQWSKTIDGVVVLPARFESEPQYLIGAFHQHLAELEEQRNLMPADISKLPEYKQRYWEMRRPQIEADLSPEGVKKALQAAEEIDAYNRTVLGEAAQASAHLSPRAAELITRLTPDTEGLS